MILLKLCRGNVESRISKLNENKYDALVLAEAGLNRLGLITHAKYQLKLCCPPLVKVPLQYNV